MPGFPHLPTLAAATSFALLAACSGSERSNGASQAPAGAAATQDIALFGSIALPPDTYDDFVAVLDTNVRSSRQEPGNVSFEVFRPEDGSPTLLLFERWKDQAAIDTHMQQPNLKAVIAALQSSGADASETQHLVEVLPSGAASRRAPSDPATSRDVLVVLKVKPEAEETFLQAWRDVFPHARAAPGNAVFEIYRDLDTPQTYVLIERWDSAEQHEAHLAQPYSLALDEVLPDTLAGPIVNGESRFLAHGVLD
ncbi:putative quinol monooxygenase [Phytopseudomonas dryadis]|uniref:Antibiotic biosynthesis monooxygenase n=1 Tax=Phytopseudomonas dryadis TaxID=2487520 RepID=A0A4Q9QUV8_9GAMM|nr:MULTISPECIES: antibiotic biosynthesis monooxygenase [Pseudomonas]TBU86254.1 antibiotic biosynthesis monooxygenase [Pseudomonas dryadis]TBV07690.1 antibiotic biosynthesis monooxygenase [Pseudomonas dryadis]TBV19882.1 antibiotic biosynthesis monooxygenase [Pseudomonas sp. FRB 230]